MKKAVKVLIGILFAMVLAVLVCGVVSFMGGFKTDLKSFYVVVNGDQITDQAKGYQINTIRALDVDVKYALDISDGYSVKVVSALSSDESFNYTVDDEVKSFADGNYTAGFNIVADKKHFTVTSKGNIAEIISASNEGKSVVVSDDKIMTEDEIFKLIVTSYDGKQSISINFGIKFNVPVEDITLPGRIEL